MSSSFVHLSHSTRNRSPEARRYSLSISIATQRRCRSSATEPVVLLPANGSSTMSPGSVVSLMKNQAGLRETVQDFSFIPRLEQLRITRNCSRCCHE